jgi:hypothetical protein
MANSGPKKHLYSTILLVSLVAFFFLKWQTQRQNNICILLSCWFHWFAIFFLNGIPITKTKFAFDYPVSVTGLPFSKQSATSKPAINDPPLPLQDRTYCMLSDLVKRDA